MLHSETKGGTGMGLFDGISGNILCSHKTSLYLEVHQTEYRRANARNITFRNSLRLPINIINSDDEKKNDLVMPIPLPLFQQHSTTVSLETYSLFFPSLF